MSGQELVMGQAQAPAMIEEAEFDFLVRIVHNVVNTEFVPRDLRGKPEACLACIMYGRALGLDPMIALREVSVIDGQPSLSAVLIMGRVLQAGHTVYVTESSDERCTIYGKRGDSGAELSLTWTIEQAAQIQTRIRGETVSLLRKDNWRNYPRAMLRARVATELGRTLFPDVFSGMSLYTAEELGAQHTDEEGRPLDGAIEEGVAGFASDAPTVVEVTPHETGPTTVQVEPAQPQPVSTPPVPAEPPQAATAVPGPVAEGEGAASPGAAPEPVPDPRSSQEERVDDEGVAAAARESLAEAAVERDESGALVSVDVGGMAAGDVLEVPVVEPRDVPVLPDDHVIAEDPQPEVSVAELAERAKQAQLEAPREDLRPQPEAGVVPGQEGLPVDGPGPSAAGPGPASLTPEQEIARDVDITEIHTWGVQDLRKLASRIGVKSRELKKPELLADVRVKINRLRGEIAEVTSVESSPLEGEQATGVAAPSSPEQEGPTPPVATLVSPSPEAVTPVPAEGPVVEPAAPPAAEPVPAPVDFQPRSDFEAPAGSHAALPELPPNSGAFSQPFSSLSQAAQAVLMEAAIAFSTVHFPMRDEWMMPAVTKNIERHFQKSRVVDLQAYQLESMWRALPDDVKKGLAAHYTSQDDEGTML